jgi:hypothetical protein
MHDPSHHLDNGLQPLWTLRRLLAEWLQRGDLSPSVGITFMRDLDLADLRSAKPGHGHAATDAGAEPY